MHNSDSTNKPIPYMFKPLKRVYIELLAFTAHPETSQQFKFAARLKFPECLHKPRNSKQCAVAASRTKPSGWSTGTQRLQPPLLTLPSGTDSFLFLLGKQRWENRSWLSQEDGEVKEQCCHCLQFETCSC